MPHRRGHRPGGPLHQRPRHGTVPATATTAVRGPGRHELRFSNCDNELRLWVDGRVVQFDAPTSYEDLGNTLPEPSDRLPVGVASRGAKVRLSHLAIFRDIYYIADLSYAEHQRFAGDDSRLFPGSFGDNSVPRNRAERVADFPLKADQFFVLGDNSPRSKDGRLWGHENYWVPRELLIGKALFIYWPHSWNKIPVRQYPLPVLSQFRQDGVGEMMNKTICSSA